MSKLGNLRCFDINCNACPFNTPKRLSICTGAKLNQTLSEHLERAKINLTQAKIKTLEIRLNEEVDYE